MAGIMGTSIRGGAMRGKKAKFLRLQVYGNRSRRNAGLYDVENGTAYCSGLRGVYLRLKRALRRGDVTR